MLGRGHASLEFVPVNDVPLQSRVPSVLTEVGSGGLMLNVPLILMGQPWQFPLGGEIDMQFGPERVDVSPSWIATPLTAVAFDGWTKWGNESHIPFEVNECRLAGKRSSNGCIYDRIQS